MPLPTELFQGLEEQLKGIMQKYKIPGMSFAIVEGNQAVYLKGLGYRDKEKELDVTPNTVFQIGSTSKSFTALGIMKLVEQGRLDLKDPIDKYLPITWARKYGDDNPITIHHLLSQTSGISDLGLARITITAHLPDKSKYTRYDVSTNEKHINHLNGGADFINPPGRYSYCNSNFNIAAMIIEKVTGESYADYMQKILFTPCKMGRSTYNAEEFDKFDDKQTGYYIHHENGEWKAEPRHGRIHPAIWGAGGVQSTAVDLSNYVSLLMNEGKFENHSIISQNSLEMMFKRYTRCSEIEEAGSKGFGSSGRGGYGYGWFVIDDFFGHKFIMHLGDMVTSSSIIAFIPDLKIGIIEMCNGGEEVTGDIIPTVFGTFAAILGKNPMEVFTVIQEDMRLDKLCGTYYDYIRGHPLKITREGCDLFIEWLGDFPRPKIPLHPTDKEGTCFNYYTKPSPMGFGMVEFKIEDDGRIRLLLEKHTMFKEE